MNQNTNKPNKYSELEDRQLSNVHLHTLLKHHNQLLRMGAAIHFLAKPLQDRSEFYEPEDITSVINRVYQQNAIEGRP